MSEKMSANRGGLSVGQRRGGCSSCIPNRQRAGFTVLDVLVTMGVVSVLIGILVPTLSGAREQANRVVCASNIRQTGLATSLYTEDFKGYIPGSIFLGTDAGNKSDADEDSPDQMLLVRVNKKQHTTSNPFGWDGLGHLYEGGYMYAPKVFYCPSHKGTNHLSKYLPVWSQPTGEIASNFQYRGEGPNGERKLYMIEPSSSALVTDGMRTLSDFNHRVGANVLRADLAVRWYVDSTNIADRLPPDALRAGDNGDNVRGAWRDLDEPSVPR